MKQNSDLMTDSESLTRQSTRGRSQKFSSSVRQNCWEKAEEVAGRDPDRYAVIASAIIGISLNTHAENEECMRQSHEWLWAGCSWLKLLQSHVSPSVPQSTHDCLLFLYALLRKNSSQGSKAMCYHIVLLRLKLLTSVVI